MQVINEKNVRGEDWNCVIREGCTPWIVAIVNALYPSQPNLMKGLFGGAIAGKNDRLFIL